MVYNFMITEYLRRSVKVEAQSEEEAYELVENLVNNEEIILSADDFCGRDIESMSVFTDGSVDTNDVSYETDDDFTKGEAE